MKKEFKFTCPRCFGELRIYGTYKDLRNLHCQTCKQSFVQSKKEMAELPSYKYVGPFGYEEKYG